MKVIQHRWVRGVCWEGSAPLQSLRQWHHSILQWDQHQSMNPIIDHLPALRRAFGSNKKAAKLIALRIYPFPDLSISWLTNTNASQITKFRWVSGTSWMQCCFNLRILNCDIAQLASFLSKGHTRGLLQLIGNSLHIVTCKWNNDYNCLPFYFHQLKKIKP